MKRVFLLILSFIFLGGAVSSSAFFINNSINAVDTQTIGGGESQSDILENDDNVTANAPTNSGSWTDSGNYATSFAGGSGTETDPYLIETPQQLAYLSLLINTTSTNSTYRSLYYEQTTNLDMSAYYWDAIGYSASYNFRGYYNGGGHTISGLYTRSGSSSTYSYQGLFGYIQGVYSGQVGVYNLGIINSEIQGYQYVGGIAGYIYYYVNITDCYNSGVVNGSSDYVGGLVGYAASTSAISNSYNTGAISGSNNYVGGIVGYVDASDVYNSYNEGTINANSFLGGIAGYNDSSSDVYYCYNTGTISSVEGTIGGIVGYNYDSSDIYDCYNLGSISGRTAGGIAGYNYEDAKISNCYNLGSVTCSAYGGGISGYNNSAGIYNCFNLGAIITVGLGVNDAGVQAGAIVGRFLNDGFLENHIEHCYWGVNCTLTVGAWYNNEDLRDCTTCSSEDPRNLTWYSTSSNWDTSARGGHIWDFDTVWSINPSQNNGYPILQSLIQNYEISFDANGGQGNMVSLEVVAGDSVTLTANSFTRTGYEFAGWALSSSGSVVYSDGQTITPTASMTLYAVWRVEVYTITLDWQGGSGGRSVVYFQYGGSYAYTDESCSTGLAGSALLHNAERAGFSFVSFTTNADGSGTVMYQNYSYLNTATIVSDDVWYAQWQANNEAKYDSAGGYWYVENGKIPQTKVTDSTLISALNSATTTGSTYYIAGLNLQSRVYNGTEYCQWNGNWYEVEPIRWRLTFSSNQTDGYGTTTATNAVLAEIVYVGQYSTESIDAGEGYSSSAVSDFMQNGISTEFLSTYTTSIQTFGNGATLYGSNVNISANIFISSESEINSVAETTAVEFSDLVNDIIKSYGGANVYFTRDLGSNYNNITCFNGAGIDSQRFATEYRGVQFTVCFTEYGCVA